ncbi:MAG: sugar ABC transporter substrate-binding protein [Bacteroidota bacterium]
MRYVRKESIAIAISLMVVLTVLVPVASAGDAIPREAKQDGQYVGKPVTDSVVATEPSRDYRFTALLPHRFEADLQSYAAALEDEAAELGVTIEISDSGGYDKPENQTAQFEAAIASETDAIILWPVSVDGLNPLIERANAAGIPVCAGPVAPSSAETTVRLDNDIHSMGVKIAQGVRKALKGKGNVYLLLGGAGGSYASTLRQGLEDELAKKKNRNIEITFEDDFPGFDPADTQSATENALVAEPEVDAIVTTTMLEMTGAIQALRAAGQDPKDVFLAGGGVQTTGDIDLIKDGTFDLVLQDSPVRAAQWLTRWCVNQLEGSGEVPTEVIRAPFAAFTPKNVGKVDMEVWLDPGVLERDL